MAPHPDDTDLEDIAKVFHEKLTVLIRACRMRDREAIGYLDLSASQSHALERLATQGPLTMNEFAEMVFLERSSASRLIERLDARGLIHKNTHPDDARAVLLTLTKKGKQLQQRLERDLVEERMTLLRELPPERRRIAVDTIAELARVATARRPEAAT